LHPYSLANDGVMQELLTGKNLSCSAVVSEIVFVDALKILSKPHFCIRLCIMTRNYVLLVDSPRSGISEHVHAR
jgi:hypothetical protein